MSQSAWRESWVILLCTLPSSESLSVSPDILSSRGDALDKSTHSTPHPHRFLTKAFVWWISFPTRDVPGPDHLLGLFPEPR